MRIAYVLTRFPKVSETFVVDEILALERRGTQVEVCSLRPGPASAAPSEAQGHVRARHCFALLSPRLLAAQLYWLVRRPGPLLRVWWRAITRHLGSPRLLANAVVAVSHASAYAVRLQRSGVVHVHAHWATHSALAAWAIHRITGLPYSFTAHADDVFVRRPMLEEKVGEADFVVAISEYGRRFLLEQLRAPSSARVRVVHCGVAIDDFRPLPPAAAEAPFTIACVARLEAKKGHGALLDACEALALREIDFRCILIGEGGERAAIERRCGRGPLRDRVEILGARPRSAVREVLARSHVFALPCIVAPNGRADGIPVALMEAMALGRPVVTTRVSGIPELVEDGRSGLLVPPHDAPALADALERIHRDPALAARLATGGRRRVEDDFDLDRNAGDLAALFERRESDATPTSAVAASPRARAEAG